MAYKLREPVPRPTRRRPTREAKLVLEEQAFGMRVEGHSLRAIAETLGVSVSRAWRHCRNGRERYREQHERSTEAHLAVELARLDAQAKELWPMARWHKEKKTRTIDGQEVVEERDVPPDVDAHYALLAINKARRAMLGLDVPKEVAIKAHVATQTATMLWGFSLEDAYPDPPQLPGPLVEVQAGANGTESGNGRDEVKR